MYEVKKLKKVNKIMKNFLIYKNKNCIYRDTGIFDEEIIINNYIQNNINFLSELNSEIDRILST